MSPLNKSEMQKYKKDLLKALENIVGTNTKIGIIDFLNEILQLNQNNSSFMRKYN